LVRKLNREFLIAAADIEWLQASGNYVNLRVHGHDYPLRSTIGGIEDKLDLTHFVRIQRSYIVNLDQIASIEPLDTGDARVHMKDGAKLPCSRTYRANLRQRFGQHG
jgi:DNA-binding LytR/AlgR family response regulator